MLAEVVQSRLYKWNLKLEEKPVETDSSWVVPVLAEGPGFDGLAGMLKVAKTSSDERPGMALLDWWDGIGAVEVLRRDADAILMPRLDDRPALGNPDDFDDATAFDILVATTNRLHQRARQRLATGHREPLPAGLTPLTEIRRHVLDLPLAKSERLASWRAFAIEFDLVGPSPLPLHGDIHHGNVMHDPAQGAWVVIDPKGYVGHPGYDFGNLFFNLLDQPQRVGDPFRMRRLTEAVSASTSSPGEGVVYRPADILDFAYLYGGFSVSWGAEAYWVEHRMAQFEMIQCLRDEGV